MSDTREKLVELLKTIPQVNQAEAYVHGLDYVFGNAADYLIANGVTFQKWIPVTERLPEMGELCAVLVVMKYDFEEEYEREVDLARYDRDDSFNIDGFVTCEMWDTGQKFIHITHWMPMPEPPEEGE